MGHHCHFFFRVFVSALLPICILGHHHLQSLWKLSSCNQRNQSTQKIHKAGYDSPKPLQYALGRSSQKSLSHSLPESTNYSKLSIPDELIVLLCLSHQSFMTNGINKQTLFSRKNAAPAALQLFTSTFLMTLVVTALSNFLRLHEGLKYGVC